MRFARNVQRRKFKLAHDMRMRATPAEAHLWSLLREKQTGLRFRRQAPLAGYIVDFYCPTQRLVIEVDGKIHLENWAYDLQRTVNLNQLGIAVYRLTNERALKMSLEDVVGYLCRRDFPARIVTVQ